MDKFKILFVFIINTIILCSCSGQKDEDYDYTESDKQKLAYISQLIEKYGWEIDSTIPETERNSMLLKEDIYILEDFLKSFDYEANDLEKKRHIHNQIIRIQYWRNSHKQKHWEWSLGNKSTWLSLFSIICKHNHNSGSI